MKLTETHTATLAFDNHQVTLKGEGVELLITYKDRKDFDKIVKGDEVEVVIGEAVVAKVKAPAKPRAPRAKKETSASEEPVV